MANKKLSKETVICAINELYDTYYDPDIKTQSEVFKFSPERTKPPQPKKEITKCINIPDITGQYNYWSD